MTPIKGNLETIYVGDGFMLLTGWLATEHGMPPTNTCLITWTGETFPIRAFHARDDLTEAGLSACAYQIAVPLTQVPPAEAIVTFSADGSRPISFTLAATSQTEFVPLGTIEKIDLDGIWGWLFDPGLALNKQAPKLRFDGWLEIPIVFNQSRPDLPFEAATTHPFGFSLSLPAVLEAIVARDPTLLPLDGGSHHYELMAGQVVVAASDADLGQDITRQLNSLSKTTRRNIVDCLIAQGQRAKVDALLRRAVKRDPRNVTAQLDLIAFLYKVRDELGADQVFMAAIEVLGEHPDLLREQVREKMRLRRWQEADDLLQLILMNDPTSRFGLLQSVRVLMSMRRYDQAKIMSARFLEEYPDDVDALYEFGRVSMELSSPEAAHESFSAVILRQPNHHPSYYRLAQLSIRQFNIENAVALISKALRIVPDHSGYLLERGRLWLSLNRIGQAKDDAEHALRLNPENPKARQILQAVEEDSSETIRLKVAAAFQCTENDVFALEANLASLEPLLEWHLVPSPPEGRKPTSDPSIIEVALKRAGQATWIAAGSTRDALTLATQLRNAKQLATLQLIEPIYGIAILQGSSRKPALTLFRKEFLQYLAQVAEARAVALDVLLRDYRTRFRSVTIDAAGTLNRRSVKRPKQPGKAFLVSRHGIELYGGGEHFLRGMAKLYRQKGFAPRIVGMRSDTARHHLGKLGSLSFADLPNDSSAMLDFALSEKPDIVHLLSGLGYEVVAPLKFLHVVTIYGTHFWRDMFEEIGGYQNLEEHAVPKREFNQIIRTATCLYSNSAYTSEIKRHYFGLATPVIYSLTDDSDLGFAEKGRYALLVNARPEKGFDFLLRLAALKPEIPFLVIASQSPVAQAEEAIAAAGLTNVKVIPRTSNLNAIYRETRVVLVPSYAFRETFSRVVIEAHRHGLPVIGSDQGNVPYLLAESGVSLPEDERIWAGEIERLYKDNAYYATRRHLANENSARYAFAGQSEKLGRLIRYAEKRILVGVGAGIGNIVQTSPLIRRLSEHYERPVDVVVNEDFPDCALLLAGSRHVNMVFKLDKNVRRREYDLVYLTHSFGNLIPSFNTNNLVVARHRFDFRMTQEIHESVFNLFCARELLGVPYETADAARYFVGSHSRSAVSPRYIGIHSGGKGGEWDSGSWLNKRWPYYRELAMELKSRGYEVASFGVAAEYVEGTTDLTNTLLAETIRNIASCKYFIGNDSGLMHIADGLGVPLTTIFGPTSVVKNGPLSSTSHIIELKKDCTPCQFDLDRFASCVCIAEVSLERVLEELLLRLG